MFPKGNLNVRKEDYFLTLTVAHRPKIINGILKTKSSATNNLQITIKKLSGFLNNKIHVIKLENDKNCLKYSHFSLINASSSDIYTENHIIT